jgi:hypothetical protein
MSTTSSRQRDTHRPRIGEVLMRSYCKELTVEEEAGGNIVSRKVHFVVYPILRWFDNQGIYHELILFKSDLDWLSEMHVSLEE